MGRYKRGLLDLRSLFIFPRYRAWYIFDLVYHQENEIPLYLATRDRFAEKSYIPEAGFFSYDHSEPIRSHEAEGLATQSYATDGIWDLPDFSQFYNKINDLYVFYLSLKKFISEITPDNVKRAIREAFIGHPLRGGSSYINLYHALASSQELSDRLSVGKLRYASPGEVDIEGDYEVFYKIEKARQKFATDYETLKTKYDNLYKYLSSNKLLKTDVEYFDTDL